MSSSVQKRIVLRLVVSSLAVVFLAVACLNFYRYAKSPTDENWFRDPPSDLYVTRGFAASGTGGSNGAGLDSVRVGDLIRELNGERPEKLEDIHRVLAELPSDATFGIELFRPTDNQYYKVLVRRSDIPDDFLRQLPPTAYVFDVISGGASDRAGMRKGDLILRINGETFNNSMGADRILRRAQSGRTIAYDILRNNQEITLHVTLAAFGIRISLVAVFLSGLVFLGVGAFLAISRPDLKGALLTGTAFMLFGYCLMVLFIQRDVQLDWLARTRNLLMVFAFPLSLAFWTHSRFYFPMEHPALIGRRLLAYLPYAVTGGVSVLIALTLFGLDVGKNILDLMAILLLVFIVGYNLVMYLFVRRKTPEDYKKISRMMVGTVVGSLVIACAVGYGCVAGKYLQQIGFIGLPLVLIPMAYVYAIGRYQLLDLNIRIRRTMQYTVVSAVWMVALVVAFVTVLVLVSRFDIQVPDIRFTGTTIEVMEGAPDPVDRYLFERIVLMISAIALAFVFIRVGQAGQRGIDRLFDRQKYDYRRAAGELAEVMATNLEMVALARGIVQKLASVMQLKRAGVLFFRDERVCCCREAHGFDGRRWHNFCMSIEPQIFEIMERFRSESRFSVNYLPDDLKKRFLEEGFRHLIPIRSQNALVGLLLVGEKLSESPFNHDDLAFLSSTAKQATIAIENAFLHERLSEQERMKHELAIARRIQLGSLPQTTPRIAGLEIAAASIPAMEVGGDYFDYLNSAEEHLTVIVGDVSGKGTSAALYMSKVQGILRSLHEFELKPRELFIRANRLLCRDLEKKSYITAIGGLFMARDRRLILARAGHLPLFYYQADSETVHSITPGGLGLGLDEADIFTEEIQEHVLDYQPGDVFLFVTDGITEAHNGEGGQFGEEKLMRLLKSVASQRAEKIRDRILEEVHGFAHELPPHDDLTVVVVKAV